MLINIGNVMPFRALQEDESPVFRPEDFDDEMPVPGCWDASRRYHDFRGRACYLLPVDLPDAACRVLRFGAVSHTARVFLDGKELGGHYGAHTAFEIPIDRRTPAGRHDVVVLVDNRFGPESTLHAPRNDWYTHGGIMRPVTLHVTSRFHISECRCVAQKIGRKSAVLTFRVRVLNATGEACRVVAKAVNVQQPLSKNVKVGLEPGVNEFDLDVTLPASERWSPEAPNLHSLAILLGDAEAVFATMIGVRDIEIRDGEILINKTPVALAGVNRHEFHPHFGQTLPYAIHARDVELIKHMGCNFVRGSHYPNDPVFLSLCDRHGIMVWQEATHWQPDAELMASDLFMRQSEQCVTEMIEQLSNHPSVIMWGLLNEARTDDERAVAPTRRLIDLMHRLDPTRPVTFACNHPMTCKCLPMADILSFNIYPGWYQGEIGDIEKKIDEIGRHLHSVKGLMPRPVIFSEFGAAAIRGMRHPIPTKWTEEYQSQLIEEFLDCFEERDWIKGFAIWQFCDIRTDPSKALTRPRGYNNKGLLDEFRQPKMAFQMVTEFLGLRDLTGDFDFDR